MRKPGFPLNQVRWGPSRMRFGEIGDAYILNDGRLPPSGERKTGFSMGLLRCDDGFRRVKVVENRKDVEQCAALPHVHGLGRIHMETAFVIRNRSLFRSAMVVAASGGFGFRV